MPIRKNTSRDLPAISTASLPDIVFMLLFFFMVSTTMRDSEIMVQIRPVKATELTKLEKKSLVSYIYIGPPNMQYREKWGTAPRIQLNDAFSTKDDIRQFIENERGKLDEKLASQMTVSLRVDKDVKMGIVTDVKQELRKANALKLNYSAVPRTEALK
ncbi:biopolymer transporter ExbD [Sphingobacteriales bacterium UPWRP_1]|nr:biopolymer transporter ExbD [Sphingobacteriales bacterium TSM_CSM]PSJ76605.1 biopolymer transporter ExbD [Sphingobacteriales bacterium UPWRP_1]